MVVVCLFKNLCAVLAHRFYAEPWPGISCMLEVA